MKTVIAVLDSPSAVSYRESMIRAASYRRYYYFATQHTGRRERMR